MESREFFSHVYPQIEGEAKKVILRAEQEFMMVNPLRDTEFLYSHSLRVSRLAYAIGRGEKADLPVVVTAALFHDAGKFRTGVIHEGDVPEEHYSAEVADEVLNRLGLPNSMIKRVKETILPLYSEGPLETVEQKVVFDADMLNKIGPMGVSNFFIKWATRGLTLEEIVETKLGAELTYISNIEKVVQTHTARRIAREKKQDTLQFFGDLIKELNDKKVISVEIVRKKYRGIPLTFVRKGKCDCGGKFTTKIMTERRVKCNTVVATHICLSCDKSYESEYCLPLVR